VERSGEKWQFLDIEAEGVVIAPSFSCGNEHIDAYLKNHALPNHKRGIAKAVVAVSLDAQEVAGFYTLSAASVERDSLPKKEGRGLPNYPVPAVLIGQLGVDQRFQGQGLGKLLVLHAFKSAVEASQLVGIRVILIEVDPEDPLRETNLQRYQKWGFVPLVDRSLTLVIGMKNVRAASEN
jgi:GNAT superfamily N-acetyltransferase